MILLLSLLGLVRGQEVRPDIIEVDVVCPPTCRMYCEFGYVPDENGCDTCECVEGPVCPEIMCLMHCENGFVKDEFGCDMCECAERPVCPEIMCLMHCENGFVKDESGCDMCECVESICTGMPGDHSCVCESGIKVSMPLMEPSLEPLNGRRKLAIRGEEMYCGMENSCIHEKGSGMFAGPISMFHDCLHMETWETYGVTSYFPLNGDEMPEGSSLAFCSDFTFHCIEEPCLMVDCMPGCDLVDTDERGCGGTCECEEPCMMLDCMPGCYPVDTDENGCGGTCECECPMCDMCPLGMTGTDDVDENGCSTCGCQYNCRTRELWTDEKTDYCCENEGLGCEPECPEIMCLMHCEYGFVQDDNGCDMCDCAPEPVECPPVMCFMHCENGYVQDEYGCDTCECVRDEVEVCPEGCTSWYDGCNSCGCHDGEITFCTMMFCFTNGEPYCMAYEEEPEPVEVCPEGCTSWFDGCNTCGCEGGEVSWCTEMFCFRSEEPYCMEYEPRGGNGLGDVCGYVFGRGDVGGCAEGLTCACVGACADPMIADYPSTCVEDEATDCDRCVDEFVANEGCECWMDDSCDTDAKIPQGCDACAYEAADACGIPMTTSPADECQMIMCIMVVCNDGSEAPVPPGECCGNLDLCEDAPPSVCSGEYGDHDCYCESGEKYAVHWSEELEPMSTEFPILGGRRRSAIMGESAYCRGENSCMYEEPNNFMMAGPMSTFYHCRDLESDETFEVTSYFPTDGDEMLGSDSMCWDYSFRCSEADCDDCVARFMRSGGCECWMDDECDEGDLVPEGCDMCAPSAADACGIEMRDPKCYELEAKYPECDDEYVGDMVCRPSQEDSDYYHENCEDEEEELPKCECEGWQSGSVNGDEMCAFQGGVNCALKYLNSEWDEGCPDNALHCVLEIPEEPEEPCANKACGEDCTPECPPGEMCIAVMQYCQADGTCGMNSEPECFTEPECPEVMCFMHCENGYVQDDYGCDTCECVEEEHLPCSGMQGDHMCVCETGMKYAMPALETPEPFIVHGRRQMAVYGEEMYCDRADSCIHDNTDVEPGLVGPIGMFHQCLHIETNEVYEVTTYFPMNGDLMSEEGNAEYCADYTFHCSEEENDRCAELEAKYPECDDEYVGDMVCGASMEERDYYRENCEGDDEEEPMPEDAVLCPGFMESEYCDCSGDCNEKPEWCGCEEAVACCQGSSEEPQFCCRAYTVECVACSYGLEPEDFCPMHPEHDLCPSEETTENPCVDNAEWSNARGLTCEALGEKFAQKGRICSSDALFENCCATCASLEPVIEDPCSEIMCPAVVCFDGSEPPVAEGECCGDMALCPKMETCPESDYIPAIGSDCSMYVDGLSCEYGEECCCGECHTNFVISCLDNMWNGYYTDACMNAECPYDEPNAELMESLRQLLSRDPSEARYEKAGRRVRDILIEKKPVEKNGLGLEYHPDVLGNLQDMKRMWKSGYTENRWAKMMDKCQQIDAILNPATTEPMIVRG